MQLRTFCRIFGSGGLFIVVVLLGCSEGVQSLQFTVEPISVDAIEGTPINLQCAVDESNVQIQWTLDGQLLDLDNDDRRSLEDNNLRISAVDKNNDAGEFQCIATMGAETITSDPAELNIIWISSAAKVNLKVPATEEEIVDGTRVTLQCKGDGNPQPEFSWYKDDTQLQPSDNLEIGNRLKVKAFTIDDSGTYSCKAENRAGSRWSTAGNVTIILEDPNAPAALVTPEDVLVLAGDTVQFDCSFSGDPTPSAVWYYRVDDDASPLGPLTSGQGMSILNNGSLVLESVKTGEAGTYMCMPRRDGRQIDNLVLEANLVIAKVDDLLPLGPQLVVEDDPYRVNCTFPNNAPGGVPLPEITWYDSSGTPVTDDTSNRVHHEGSFLVFKAVRGSDTAGEFTCKANNLAGEKQSQLTIEIAVEPEIIMKPQDKTVRELTTSMLHCQATGNPRPTIGWSKTSNLIESQRFETAENGSLIIHNVQVKDGGVYVCKASNIAGDKMAHATFLVDVVLKFTPDPIGKTFEKDVEEKLTCNAQASTTPKVQWFKRNGDSFTAITQSHIEMANGSIIFKPAMKSDAGYYTCVATAGTEIINATVKVDVFVKPKFTIVPKNSTGYEGYSLYIDCQARGDPPPAITWTAITPTKLPSHFISHKNGTLIVDQVLSTDGGRYQCVAGNNGGLNTTEIVITIKKGSPPTASAFSNELMTRTIAIAVGCAAAYIILVIGLMWWCRHRRRKQRRLMKEEENMEKANGTLPNGEGMPLNEYHGSNPSVANNTAAVNPNYKAARRASYDKMQFPRHDLQSLAVIGHGAFGEVFLARAVGIRDGEEATTVMVKALQTRDEHQQLEFRREIDMLTKLNHANIVKLLGLCREAEPQLMITEYLDWGDLKQYLRATRGENGTTSNPPPLTQSQKIDIVNQIAQGMEHLSNNRFIHADLAARNCLLSPSMEVKISLMGTSKDLYRAEYHDYHQCLMPVRWMPSEALFDDDLSTKSDVWAFGVLVWEVFSQGELPYSSLDNDAFMKAMTDGEASLEAPEGMPKEIEVVLARCWEFSPKDRCSFSDVVLAMADVSADSSV
ncbi:inactive tyrosine-protein kinase 7-like [Amphiura filiformis]|uniref:inactive tyrosine-protein kinase 7-like n=1 Tax=Amphiura filiformis TaxID=82378 RepID=UPI003B21AD26